MPDIADQNKGKGSKNIGGQRIFTNAEEEYFFEVNIGQKFYILYIIIHWNVVDSAIFYIYKNCGKQHYASRGIPFYKTFALIL